MELSDQHKSIILRSCDKQADPILEVVIVSNPLNLMLKNW